MTTIPTSLFIALLTLPALLVAADVALLIALERRRRRSARLRARVDEIRRRREQRDREQVPT